MTKRKTARPPELVVPSDEQVKEMATMLGLSSNTPMDVFREDVCRAFAQYSRFARPNNEIHHEIAGLARAATSSNYSQAAHLIRNLSTGAHLLLRHREERSAALTGLPDPQDLLSISTRDQACRRIELMTIQGGFVKDGRARQCGKRSSPTMAPVLYAPPLRGRPTRRDAEMWFLIWLRVAVTEATGSLPTPTANASAPGPFARFVQKCLDLAGAQNVSAADLINRLNTTVRP
jgi:hypothetical protein